MENLIVIGSVIFIAAAIICIVVLGFGYLLFSFSPIVGIIYIIVLLAMLIYVLYSKAKEY